MRREDLANELRGVGNGLRYADGPVAAVTGIGSSERSLHSPTNKLKTSDWKVVRMAATCSQCDAVASKEDIELAEQWADCYQSFARLIWPCIDHEKHCSALPYISVSESVSKHFQKLKARFEAKRQARAEARSKMTPDELASHNKKRREAREKREAEDWKIYFSRLQAAVEKEKKQGKASARKPAAKKSRPAKTAKKKPAPKKPSKKKSPKRKKR